MAIGSRGLGTDPGRYHRMASANTSAGHGRLRENYMALRNLKNKQVLITGGSAGIGYESALAFARRGSNIILVDVDAKGLETAADAIRELGVECRTWTVDVSDEQAMTTLAKEVHAAVGALDVLVNNAGIGYMGPFLDTPHETWRRILGVNLMGVVYGCSFFLPEMIKAGGPRHVVNVASTAGLGPATNLSAYAASKHAVVGLTDTLATELSSTEVGVTVVCPGIINTAIVNPSGTNVSATIGQQQRDRLLEFYRTKGAHPRAVGEAIAGAVQTGKGIVLVGPFARLTYNVRRISRALLLKLARSGSRRIGYTE
jgi:NAD(P)-dependent dehydrogenase (short-subunit alcohol dehydrogenase family)